jgi:crotonobetainyl-CoA:carnitine CoA-transferase CaiB-like acyl-CoA transferase
MKILDGVRVLDLTRLLPGPLLTLFLADLGAEVIKIEDTEQGDYLRWMPIAGDGDGSLFDALNRDKRAIKLNLKMPEGVDAFKKLSENADVIVEGFRPGVMDKLGVGYDAISKINPAMVYCSISGYGKDGPYADRAGHDLNYIGVSGTLGITGTEEMPFIPGVQIGDIAGGSLSAFGAIMLGLYNRGKTGKGVQLDISMVDSLIVFMAPYLPYMKTGLKRGEMELTGSIPCYNVYRTKDGKFITIGALEPKFWTRFAGMVGRKDLVDKQLAKGEEFKEVYSDVQGIFLTKTRAEWAAFFEGNDVCIEPVNELDELLVDPHIKYRGMFGYTDNGRSLTIRNPFYKEKQNGGFKNAPKPGEHTVEILKEAGYTDKDIEQMKRKGVI